MIVRIVIMAICVPIFAGQAVGLYVLPIDPAMFMMVALVVVTARCLLDC